MAFRLGINSALRRVAQKQVGRVFSAAKDPVGVLVTVEIKPERINEFLDIMKGDAIDSCTKENGGCLRFDVLSHTDNAHKFTFYEVYKDDAAVAFHKTTAHYQKWADFKATGAVLSQAVQKFTLPITATVANK